MREVCPFFTLVSRSGTDKAFGYPRPTRHHERRRRHYASIPLNRHRDALRG